jgi:hypothetical protein
MPDDTEDLLEVIKHGLRCIFSVLARAGPGM